jgi:hypothetical protein
MPAWGRLGQHNDNLDPNDKPDRNDNSERNDNLDPNDLTIRLTD